MFERFTDRARRVLVLTQEEVKILQDESVETQHLLLGLIHEGDGVAGQVLTQHGITLERVRSVLKPSTTKSQYVSPPSPAFSPEVKKVLEGALRGALKLGHNYIGTEHLLLALLHEEDSNGVRLLQDLGIDVTELRQQVLVAVTLFSSQGTTSLEQDEHRIDLTRSPRPRPSSEALGPQEGPNCPRCNTSLDVSARYRTLNVPPGPGEQNQERLEIKLLYCSQCGATMNPLS